MYACGSARPCETVVQQRTGGVASAPAWGSQAVSATVRGVTSHTTDLLLEVTDARRPFEAIHHALRNEQSAPPWARRTTESRVNPRPSVAFRAAVAVPSPEDTA
jgi:hypothetical protein